MVLLVQQVVQEQILVQIMDVLVQHVQYSLVAVELVQMNLIQEVLVVLAVVVKVVIDLLVEQQEKQEHQGQLILVEAVAVLEVVQQIKLVDQVVQE